MSTWGERLGVFDLETTGVDVDTSRIVSACVAVLDEDGGVVSRWNWLADPGVDIPAGASAVHGITTERAQEQGRPATLVIAEIVQTLRVLLDSGIPVTIYNAPYDLTLLDREARRHGIEPLSDPGPVIDPLVIDKAVDRYRKGKRTLEVTAALYEVSLDDAHDAGADAIAAGRVALALLRRYPDELDVSLADLHGRQEVWHAEQAASFQEYLRGKRGDDSYVADPSWPLKPAGDANAFVDTQPIPPLPPRPSGNVPVLDFSATGVLALETSRAEATRSARWYENQKPDTHLDDPFVEGDDSEPAWIIEPSEVPLVTVDESDAESSHESDAEGSHESDEEVSVADSPEGEAVRSDSLSVAELVEGFPLRRDEQPDPYGSDDANDPDDANGSGGQLWVLDDTSIAEPQAAHDAVGEPESVAPGPPPAVLRIAAAIVTDPDGRCLLVRKAGTSVFMQAGGKLEPGESALDALARELQEELGLELDEASAEYLGVFRAEAANEPRTVVSAAVFALETSAAIDPRGEIEELRWIDSLDTLDVDVAPLSRDELLPLWESRRSGAAPF